MYLDAEELGFSTSVNVVTNREVTPALPRLEFESANPDVFAVRATWCRGLLASADDPLEPCPVESPRLYAVELDLRSEGSADLIARLASDGSVYDRGTVRIRSALCERDSTDVRCTD